MKTSCKDIDIKDWEADLPWVRECIEKHAKRYDFRDLLCGVGGMAPEEYRAAIGGEKEKFKTPAERISKEAAKRITERRLKLSPVRMEEKQDHSSLKIRLIGKESAMQQIFDHIAVKAANDIWRRRYVPQQASSIKGRGQVYGTKMISRWIKKDARAAQWAQKHGRKYYRKCRYFTKLDIKKCYPSMRLEHFLKKFKRDCGNEDLIWLWETLLTSHKVNGYEGFMIGALVSQQAAQYILSFIYGYAVSLHKERRGKKVKLISHMLLFMDDQLVFSSSYRDLKVAVRKVIEYAKSEFGITIKPEWQICDIDKTPVDMMGFVIHKDGNASVRPRVYLRARRLALRIICAGGVSLRQAKRLASYKGHFTQKRNRLPMHVRAAIKKLRLTELFKKAAKIISNHERREKDAGRVQLGTGGNCLHAVA